MDQAKGLNTMQDRDNAVTSALLKMCLAQAVVVLLAGLNLYLPWSHAPLTGTLNVRWTEIISLSIITPVGIVLLFLIHCILEKGRVDATGPLLLLVLGTCWLAVSMGIHEPINALGQQVRRVEGLPSRLLWFWDDVFSHGVFFAGYVTTSLAVFWCQHRNPLKDPMRWTRVVLFLACGVLGGVGIVYALTPSSRMGVDLLVILGVLVVAEVMRKGCSFRKRPLNIVIETGYLLALIVLGASLL